jgi:hypothetical protein
MLSTMLSLKVHDGFIVICVVQAFLIFCDSFDLRVVFTGLDQTEYYFFDDDPTPESSSLASAVASSSQIAGQYEDVSSLEPMRNC